MEGTKEELPDLGVAAVDAGEIEQALLQQVEHQGGAPAPVEGSGQPDLDQLEQQLQAVRRELRAVRTVVEGLGNQAEQPEQPPGSDQDGDSVGALQAPAAMAAGGALQQAVMTQRLTGLEEQQRQLEDALTSAGRPPLPQAAAALASSSVEPAVARAGQQPAQQQRRGQQLPPKGRKSAKLKAPASELLEVDIFGGDDGAGAEPGGSGGALVETERDRLIRLGVLTPFDRLDGFERRVERGPSQRQAGGAGGDAAGGAAVADQQASIARLAQKVRDVKAAKPTTKLLDASELPNPERPTRKVDEGFWRQSASGRVAPAAKKKRKRTLARTKLKKPKLHGPKKAKGRAAGSVEEELSGSEGEASEGSDLSGSGYSGEDGSGSAGRTGSSSGSEDLGGEFDDADEELYQQRTREHLRRRRRRKSTSGQGFEEDGEEEDVVFEGGLRIPADIYTRLFDYQKTGVKWLWELHTQRAGGIIGDEMGLGKTIQVITFLGGLHHSGLFRPSLVVCPATVLRQWLRELRAWYPLFRVAILHESVRSGATSGARPAKRQLIQDIGQSEAGILVTTYDQLRLQRADVLSVEWGYVVLDEGHKIRNPDAEVTLAAKQVQTVHRLIMTGSPIQNRLTELWSLFDFVFPGKLGTLPVFQAQFALPIQIGGYSNASAMQVSTAYKCAVILRDLISPYLLRRRKADVSAQLPKKTEQVLFCTLTPEQRELYKSYLSSKDLAEIYDGHRTALAGIDILRKICNHPDLLERAKWEAAQDYGNAARSGKMVVLAKVLHHWKEQGHKALVFTQTQQMLDILEKFAGRQGYTYHRMDGSTSIAMRARLMDDFNNNPDVFLFLLTTRVGGLGVNLTGANRVLLYDPDWNPATDVQARERAWRIGQKRDVTVYRLITSGTVEEKIYHRQVYKHFLTDKVLRDPRQKRFFKARDLRDLFTLGDEYQDGTETGAIFASLDTEIRADDLAAAGAAGEATTAQHSGEAEEPPGSSSDRDDYVSGSAGGSSDAAGSSGGGIRQVGSRDGLSDAAGGTGTSQRQQQRRQHGRSRGSSKPPRLRGASQSPGMPGPRQAGAAATGPVAQGGEEPDEDSEKGGDAKILKDLFEGRGVRSAIDHDKIEGASGPDRVVVDHEAARIARRAAEALRQSRLQVQQAPINQPTWTGRSGLAGAPGAAQQAGQQQQPRFGRTVNPRLQQQQQQAGAGAGESAAAGAAVVPQPARRFGSGALAGAVGGVAPRSADILAQMRARQQAVASAGRESPAGAAAAPGAAAAAAAAAAPGGEVARAQLLAAQIVSFIEHRGGAAPSDELVSHFQAECCGDAAVAVFRGCLKQVAQLQRRQQGAAKVWVLRPEFAAAGEGPGGDHASNGV